MYYGVGVLTRYIQIYKYISSFRYQSTDLGSLLWKFNLSDLSNVCLVNEPPSSAQINDRFTFCIKGSSIHPIIDIRIEATGQTVHRAAY